MEPQELPLFPLNCVLFPRGRLDLQIFEQRYIDLVSDCLRQQSGFGIVLIKNRHEAGKPGKQTEFYDIGTMARIVDWDSLPNGLLGITVEGEKKFRVVDFRVAENGLIVANVSFSKTDTAGTRKVRIEEDVSGLTELLKLLEQHPAVQKLNLKIDYENLWELGWRLSELVPVALEIRQELLEIDDPWDRIKVIDEAISFLTQ